MTLCYLDQCGFSPSQPVTYSWTRRGERKRIPYENPQGRRRNVLAALVKHGPSPSLTWDAAPRTLRSADLLAFLPTIPRRTDVPLVVVLDNASLHRSAVVKAALPALWAKRIYLYFLPPYSPELNDIERRPSNHRGVRQQPQSPWEYRDREPGASTAWANVPRCATLPRAG